MKWIAIGLNDDYREIHGDTRTTEMNFKNVAITDNEDFDKATFCIWDRVWKNSEEADIARIKAILKAGETISL